MPQSARQTEQPHDETPRALTERRIADLPFSPGRQVTHWDIEPSGFGVRVGARRKTFVYKYRTRGRHLRWATLGRVGDITLKAARALAKRYAGLVADGKDPLASSDTARTAPTFREVAETFLEQHVDARRKPSTQRNYRQVIYAYLLPTLSSRPVTEITTAQLAARHAALRSTPVQANRTLAVASKLFAWCEQRGLRPPHTNPARGIEKFRETARRRYLTAAEYARLGCALRVGARYGRITPAARLAIELLAMTGARVSEILTLEWAHVDLDAGALRLPDSKTGAKVILIGPEVVAQLRAWPQWETSPYVFPGEGRGQRKGAHRVSLVKPWRWICRRARLTGVRVHDLRHGFASVAVSSGLGLPVVGAMLGHTQAQTTARYAHLHDEALRAATSATSTAIADRLVRR